MVGVAMYDENDGQASPSGRRHIESLPAGFERPCRSPMPATAKSGPPPALPDGGLPRSLDPACAFFACRRLSFSMMCLSESIQMLSNAKALRDCTTRF